MAAERDRIRVTPSLCAYVDENHQAVTMEVVLPGVKKEDITLKMHEDSFNLSAPRENVEYVAAYSFCCPVNPDRAEATYDNGLLRIQVPFKDPMEDAVKIAVA